MPGYVAANFVENLLFTLSACERAGVRYFAHWGTLLGAHRLEGLCPWDEDADVFLLDEDRASIERKLGDVLRAHGFDLTWDAGGHYWVRQRPWWAGQGHVALEFLPRAPAGSPRPDWDPWLPPAMLLPLRPYPFYGSWIAGPADAEAVLDRLYGETGRPAAMERFTAPPVPPEARAFWSEARAGTLDWEAISARFLQRKRSRPLHHVATFPWWWFNGGYNVGIKRLRGLGRALAPPSPPV